MVLDPKDLLGDRADPRGPGLPGAPIPGRPQSPDRAVPTLARDRMLRRLRHLSRATYLAAAAAVVAASTAIGAALPGAGAATSSPVASTGPS